MPRRRLPWVCGLRNRDSWESGESMDPQPSRFPGPTRTPDCFIPGILEFRPPSREEACGLSFRENGWLACSRLSAGELSRLPSSRRRFLRKQPRCPAHRLGLAPQARKTRSPSRSGCPQLQHMAAARHFPPCRRRVPLRREARSSLSRRALPPCRQFGDSPRAYAVGVTPFFSSRLPYLRTSPVITIAKAPFARS